MTQDRREDRFPWEETGESEKIEVEAAPRHSGEPEDADTDDDVKNADRATNGRGDADEGDARLDAVAARIAARERPIAPKEYYAISEVCDVVGLKPHVLRYWETQFQVLNPSKNRSGNRVYQRKEIRLILLVKHLLYEEKYTVEGAKQRIEQLRRGGKLRDVSTIAIDDELLTLLHDDLHQLLDVLAPDDPA